MRFRDAARAALTCVAITAVAGCATQSGSVKGSDTPGVVTADQRAAGWRLLPITLGPQAWCTTRDRYLHQVRIDPHPTDTYAAARKQGRAEADKTIAATGKLGITKGSTQWYDIEAFDTSMMI